MKCISLENRICCMCTVYSTSGTPYRAYRSVYNIVAIRSVAQDTVWHTKHVIHCVALMTVYTFFSLCFRFLVPKLNRLKFTNLSCNQSWMKSWWGTIAQYLRKYLSEMSRTFTASGYCTCTRVAIWMHYCNGICEVFHTVIIDISFCDILHCFDSYGQTGTGKTFTMEGEKTPDESLSWEEVR